jgi:hypothetical protein
MTRIGIVGHRYFSDDKVLKFVVRQTNCILEKIWDQYSDLVALSAIAEGADTIFAEAALALGIPLEIVRPYTAYSSDFATAAARYRYDSLRVSARRENRLRYTHRSDEAYETAMNWVVTRSDLLVVVWDGYPANGPGGTGQAVNQAIRLNLSWIHINVSNLTVTHHLSKASKKVPCESLYANTA